jgi:hypothetical protein
MFGNLGGKDAWRRATLWHHSTSEDDAESRNDESEPTPAWFIVPGSSFLVSKVVSRDDRQQDFGGPGRR